MKAVTCNLHGYEYTLGLPWWFKGKEFTYNAGDTGSIPESGRSPGGGNGNPPQYSCLEYPTDRGTLQATVHGVAKELDTAQQLNNNNNHKNSS